MSESSLKPFGLYIHWPFCVSKCPYCDFNSHVRVSIDQNRWQNALVKELEYVGNLTKGRRLQSVFFGGGTPSLMDPGTVKTLLDLLDTYWQLDNPEITLEANPNSIEVNKLKAFKKAGINRVSIGIQSLNPEALKFLGRAHSRDEATRALEIAAETFERYSFDLIYARPGQTLKEWEQELTQALPFIRDHISLYQLTIEPNTAFHTAHQRKDFTLPKEDLAARMYKQTHEILTAIGLDRYEISNHAKPGYESRHNLIYWRYGEYAGIGPGAHGRLTINSHKMATKCYRAPETWLTHVETHGHGYQEKIIVSLKEQVLETLMMGLRLQEGINLSHFLTVFNSSLMTTLEQDRVEALIKEGYAKLTSESFHLTSEGFLRLNAILAYLTEPLLSKAPQAMKSN